jgi:hypothetical protein
MGEKLHACLRLSLIGPYRKLISTRIGEVKPSTTGEFENARTIVGPLSRTRASPAAGGARAMTDPIRSYRFEATFRRMSTRQGLLRVAMALLVSACGSDPQAPPSPTVASITVLPDDVPVLSISQEIQLSVVVTSTTGGTIANPPVTWVSSNAAVASVTAGGVLRGLADGDATITASLQGRSGSASFRIVDLSGTWTGGESPDTVSYVLLQTGTSVTGTFQSRLGFPPITNVMTGALTGTLGFDRYEHTLTLTAENGCELIITGTHAVGVQLTGELVLVPAGVGTLSSSNCGTMGTINFATLRR